mgnify:FL=1
MDVIVTYAVACIPILTNWFMMDYTHDFVAITFVDILVMYLCYVLIRMILGGSTGGSCFSCSMYTSFNLIYLIIVFAAAAAYFVFMHTTMGKYACGGFTFLMPSFRVNWEPIVYWIAFFFLFVLSVPEMEVILYGGYVGKDVAGSSTNTFGHLIASIIIGIISAAKSIWIIRAIYQSCGADLTWIIGVLVGVQIFTRWVNDSLAVRQLTNICLFVGAMLIYYQVSFVKHSIDKTHSGNIWNK